MNISRSQKAVYIIISILIAVVLWLYVDNTGANERDVRLYNVPVTFIGENEELADRGLMILSGEDTTIDLRLQGRRQVVSRINRSNIKITVDVRTLSTVGAQSLDYTITYPSNVLSSSVTLVSASLYKVPVVIGELHSKSIPVVLDVSGSVADGFLVREAALTPQTLTVSGTEEDIAAIDHALVEVTLDEVRSSYSNSLSYRLVDAQGEDVDDTRVRKSEESIQVDIPVVTLKELPLTVDWVESSGSRTSDITYEIEPSSVTLSGEESTLDKLDELHIGEVDLSQVLGNDVLELEIPIPGGCVNESGTDTAKVTIRFQGLQTQTFECSNISFANVTEGYTPTAITRSLDVTLRGTAAELENVSAGQIRVVVDLADVSTASGTYMAKAKIYVDGTDAVGAIGSYQVSYRLSKN